MLLLMSNVCCLSQICYCESTNVAVGVRDMLLLEYMLLLQSNIVIVGVRYIVVGVRYVVVGVWYVVVGVWYVIVGVHGMLL